MENNQNHQTPSIPVQPAPLQNPQPVAPVQQVIPPTPEIETKDVKKKHSWINYVFIALSLIQAVSVFFGQIGVLQIIGAVYYFVTAFVLFKKPKIGYVMFGAAILLFVVASIIYRYTASY